VRVAADGASGVEEALARPPDIALVDLGLPLMDGYEVARRIRAAAGRRTYLVALTGYGLAEDRQKSLEAGFDLHLVKPVTEGLLEDMLQKAARAA
jgi:CheY-like chemotaxis protein